MKKIINCVIGIISNTHGYLLLKRQKEPYKDFFEFPGGKIKKSETSLEALERELNEELSIYIKNARFINKIVHEYKEFSVCLNIFEIVTYKGTIRPNEQEILYCKKENFKNIKCLSSTYRTIKLLDLPRFLSIFIPENTMINNVTKNIKKNEELLIRFRDINNYYSNNIEKIIESSKVCREKDIRFIIDHPHEKDLYSYYDGIHYKSKFLSMIKELPNNFIYYSCSCHSISEVKKANLLNFDYILISPVKEAKYLNEKHLGWKKFKELSLYANMPTFALGGISKDDITLSKDNGGYGVSGIRNF